MLIKSEQLSVGSLIKNVMLKYLFWASYILRLCAQTCTPNRHALDFLLLTDLDDNELGNESTDESLLSIEGGKFTS